MVDERVINLVNAKVVPYITKEQNGKDIGIVAIIEIALAVIKIFQECKNIKENLEKDSDKVIRMIRNPNFFNKARLYLTVKRQCKQNGTKEYLNTIVKALLEAGKTVTKEDVQMICSTF